MILNVVQKEKKTVENTEEGKVQADIITRHKYWRTKMREET